MAQELVQINVRNPLIKMLLILLLLVAGVWSYFVVRWYLGNTLAEYFNPAESSFDAAGMGVSLAPNDALTHWRAAQVLQKNLPLDQQGPAIAEYEKATDLSPNDYRYWMTLGTAYERAGEANKGEQALKRAITLAPSYSYPHWFLGNLLLRNARYDEAFAELRIASKADPELQSQLFGLAWAVYSDDLESMKKAVGESAADRAAFALNLLTAKHFAEGLKIWDGLSNEEKKANQRTARQMIDTLKDNFRFHDALKIWNDSTPTEYSGELDHVFDGGFEKPIPYGPEIVFGWQVNNNPQMQIGLDPDKSHDGSRSLKLVYEARTTLEAVNVFQIVPVQPGTDYDLECYVSTKDLVTGSAPKVDVLDPTTNGTIVSSTPAPSGTNPWTKVTTSFKTGDKTEAVLLRVVRVSCATKDTPVCPIFGTVWYDDFTIKRRK
ncbi:MAG TPA: carbohydrate binding domain-containing protein [Pyrinomonadaceae bacterium]|jgi:cytochrome c-type biogenesis protein CcmH/NrfG